MHHFIKGHPLHVEKFVGVQLLLAEFQPLGQKQVQRFPIAAGSGQELAEGQADSEDMGEENNTVMGM